MIILDDHFTWLQPIDLNLDLLGIINLDHESTRQKMNNLFQVNENSIEQYFAAHIVLGC